MESIVLDIILVLILIGYTIFGYRSGLLASFLGLTGLILGAVIGYFCASSLGNIIESAPIRFGLTIFIFILFLVLGHYLGTQLGRWFKKIFPFKFFTIIDKILGAIFAFFVTGVVIVILASAFSFMSIPGLNQVLTNSKVIKVGQDLMPQDVKHALTRWTDETPAFRDLSLLPEGWTLENNVSEVPKNGSLNEVQENSSQSVVKVSSNAYGCGQSQLGSGVVVAPERIMTNAHVVAGTTDTEITGKTAEFGSFAGKVVYFDPQKDIAIIAAEGLKAQPVKLSKQIDVDEKVSFLGYPGGGPFSANPAVVDGIPKVMNPDIYGKNPSETKILQLAANVKPGNSGGPVFDERGDIGGLIFASTRTDKPIGYALALEEVRPVVDEAVKYKEPVDTGRCVSEEDSAGQK